MEILVVVKTVYGLRKIYPANDAAKAVAAIAGTKTLSVENLRCAKLLGHAVREKFEPM